MRFESLGNLVSCHPGIYFDQNKCKVSPLTISKIQLLNKCYILGIATKCHLMASQSKLYGLVKVTLH